jgi:hypothetical protein
MLDAYAVLGVGYDASIADVRRAYRALARRYHPDRVPARSPEQQRATEQMAAINAAYALIIDAPLRHHPISRPSDPDLVFTQPFLDEALRRARAERIAAIAQTTVLVVLITGLFIVSILPALQSAGVSVGASALILVAGLTCFYLLRHTGLAFRVPDAIVGVVRLLLVR